MNREIAELHYIVEAMQLDGYGMEFYAVKDEVSLIVQIKSSILCTYLFLNE